MVDSDDEPITLSSHALAALTEFNAEKDAHRARFEKLQAKAEAQGPLSMEAFTEDWNESQFWYSDEVAHVLGTQLLHGSTSRTVIGVVSAPSVFVALRNILRTCQESERPRLVLLEHDQRFNVFPEFVFYDYKQPLKLPDELKGILDRVICDPPFLSQDCQTKAAMTVRWLLKAESSELPRPRVIVCTGERMEHLVTKLYQPLGVQTTTFEPKHARGLSNEFYCYANFESSSWAWRQERF
ncbi:putative N6-adenine methyltransferase [Hirsutella rhossiliensis]|uniref:Protein-lysine N-methyltransferase EFM5 n=1 Tax=Hirsutella rhossiliensis TaxID=111463 RepID=A0A9P8MRT0_9HYPO|nr:putative N6-adenine methyltransferase domain-containing protein [Hirsutella rhossiliensis]KAH0960085.1 putative N6-adenine methyltransferase domain-containing protein [Hirsutella rhossiliensis]